MHQILDSVCMWYWFGCQRYVTDLVHITDGSPSNLVPFRTINVTDPLLNMQLVIGPPFWTSDTPMVPLQTIFVTDPPFWISDLSLIPPFWTSDTQRDRSSYTKMHEVQNNTYKYNNHHRFPFKPHRSTIKPPTQHNKHVM